MNLTIVEATEYNFTNVAAGQTLAVRLATGIDISQFKDGKLMVRLHSNGITTAVLLAVRAYNAWPMPTAPEVRFAETAAAGSVVLTSASTAGYAFFGALTQVGPALDVVIEVTQPGTPGACIAVLSIGLELWAP